MADNRHRQQNRTPAANPSQDQGGESWANWPRPSIYAGLIALVIRTFLFQPFNIPSGSMEATLLVGDYLFVEKFAYGYSRYSFPSAAGRSAIGHAWDASSASSPQRGDVVVFKMPEDNSPTTEISSSA